MKIIHFIYLLILERNKEKNMDQILKKAWKR